MFINQDDIFKATNGGLDIIKTYYPDANEKKAFKIRQEATASAHLKKVDNGIWLVTDFGDDATPRNAIQVCMREDAISFREALVKLASLHGVGGIKASINKATVEFRQPLPDEKDGEYYFEYKKQIEPHELKLLGAKVTDEVCQRYHVRSLVSFTHVTNGKAVVTQSNANYPIFVFEQKDFSKIYQPLNFDKAYRFRYVGKKPADFVFGMEYVIESYNKLQQNNTDSEAEEAPKDQKHEILIIASGDRDALNVSGFGYPVVWFNSETAHITPTQFKDLQKYADKIVLIPDLDDTGKRTAFALGLQYLDLHICWLPATLSNYNDRRGKPRKDFTDYVEIYDRREDFEKLLKAAVPLKFWKTNLEFDKAGNYRRTSHLFNSESAFQFLEANGFARIDAPNTKEGYIFVKIEKNVVSEIRQAKIKEFFLSYARTNFLDPEIKNMLHKTKQLSDAALVSLPAVKLNFTASGKDFQYMFTKNAAIEIRPGSVTVKNTTSNIGCYVWNTKVLPVNLKRGKDDKSFNISKKQDGSYDIEILNTQSHFFKVLIQTSRVHWRQELEKRIEKLPDDERKKYIADNKYNIAGSMLASDEVQDQKQHLVNKIFCIGYLLHRYKYPTRPWCVFAMDNIISEVGESNGRSGKSFTFGSLSRFINTVDLPGRDHKLTENKHLLERVTEHTDLVFIDDANQYLDFDYFFEKLSGPLPVNPKFNKSFSIPFESAPKFCITSNHTLRNVDSSTASRILFSVFSDYYHERTERNTYHETRKISDDIGKLLFTDYTEQEWANDINFLADCVAFYLSVDDKINPPMENVQQRHLLAEMSQNFKDWADVYFAPESGKLNNYVSRMDVFTDFTTKNNKRDWTPNRFNKAMKAWCRFYKYELNPPNLTGKDGRIIQREGDSTIEKYYIKTSGNDTSTSSTDMPF